MIIDEEEFLLILKLKDLKKQYRSKYQDLRDLRAEIQYCQRLVDQCRQRLLMGAQAEKAGDPQARREWEGRSLRSKCPKSCPGMGGGVDRASSVWLAGLGVNMEKKVETLGQEMNGGACNRYRADGFMAIFCPFPGAPLLTVLSPSTWQNLTSGTTNPLSSPRTCRR